MKTKAFLSIFFVQVLALFIIMPLFAEAPGAPCPTESCETFTNGGQYAYTEMSCQCPHDMEDITICDPGSFDPDSDGQKCCVMCCPECDYPNDDPPPTS